MSLTNKFYNDLRTGKKYELTLLKHIPHRSFKFMEGYFKEYDLMTYNEDSTITKYEVKSDKQINIYGNICIEYECKNKPSGISTSTADYWAIFEVKGDNYILYKIPTQIIRDYIQEKKYKRECNGGDYMASKLYLFDKRLFNDYIIFDNISMTL